MGKSLRGKELGPNIRQRKNGSFEARYTDRFGVRRSIYAAKRTEITRKLRKAQYEDEKALTIVTQDCTLDEWYETWMNICKSHCRSTTRKTYAIQYNRLKAELGWRKLKSLNLVICQDAFNKMGSDKTRRDCKALLVDMLNRAVEADLLDKNRAIGVNTNLNGFDKQEKRILSRQEVEILLENSKGGMMYPIFVVALGTGMRIGELLGLTWDCVDFENQVISVEKTLVYMPGDGKVANYEFHSPKTPAGYRIIPMTKAVYDILKIQQEHQNQIRTHFAPREGFENLVFTSKTNYPLNPSNVKESINYIVARINRENPEQYFEHFTPHCLRHTFATNCIEKGMTPKILQKILGHTSLQMTMDLYCHVREDTIREEMKKVANMM